MNKNQKKNNAADISKEISAFCTHNVKKTGLPDCLSKLHWKDFYTENVFSLVTKPDWFLTCTESMGIGLREAGPWGRISNSGACGICWVPLFCAIARHSIDALLGDFLSFVFAASLESHFAIACNWKGLFGPICFVGKKYIYSWCDSLSRWGSEEVIQVSVM